MQYYELLGGSYIIYDKMLLEICAIFEWLHADMSCADTITFMRHSLSWLNISNFTLGFQISKLISMNLLYEISES